MSYRKASSLAALILFIPFLAVAGPSKPVSDAQIRSSVQEKLNDLNLRSKDVDVHDGTVTLKGTVSSRWLKDEAADRVRKIDGVTQVVNDFTVMKAEKDDLIAEQVSDSLGRYVFFSIFDDVDGQVHDGVVTLTGKVTMPYKAKEMADLAARVRGVQAVENKIETLPVSTFDDELRVAIADRIYRDPMFWNYGLPVNPPIHVIVEHGHVTLTGVVNNQMERTVAGTIARGVFGSFSVENRLRLDEEARSSN